MFQLVLLNFCYISCYGFYCRVVAVAAAVVAFIAAVVVLLAAETNAFFAAFCC